MLPATSSSDVRLPKLKPFLRANSGAPSSGSGTGVPPSAPTAASSSGSSSGGPGPRAAASSSVLSPAGVSSAPLIGSPSGAPSAVIPPERSAADRKLFASIDVVDQRRSLSSLHKAVTREQEAKAKADASLAALHRHLHSWDQSRRAILKEVAVHKRKQAAEVEATVKQVAAVSKSLHALKPPLQTINPARVKATKMLTACQELGREWRFQMLSGGWARWRLFTAASRDEEEALARQATKLQSVYRGYRVRSTISSSSSLSSSTADPGTKPHKAACKITKFIRLVGVWKREALHRDQEAAALRIQSAFRFNAAGVDFKTSCRRRVANALAVLGGGSVSKVLRGICWGRYAAVGDGGMGIYKQSWTVTASSMAGFSKLTPAEQNLPPEVRAALSHRVGVCTRCVRDRGSLDLGLRCARAVWRCRGRRVRRSARTWARSAPSAIASSLCAVCLCWRRWACGATAPTPGSTSPKQRGC